MRSSLMAAALCLVASTASAEFLTCERTGLSGNGFSSTSAADSWFPEETKFLIEGDIVKSDVYGEGSVTRSGNRVRMEFGMKLNNGRSLKLKKTFIPSSGRYTVKLQALGGYQQTVGANGKCVVS